jgi:ABC-type antimicrobial peptide transport system permease subunit
MPRTILAMFGIAAVSFLAGSLVTAGNTQSQQPSLVVDVSFMKVEPGKEADYLKLERDLWKPVHQERIRSGHMKSWSLYQVEYPYGTEGPYDYVTLNTFSSIQDLEQNVGDMFRKVHPNIKIADVLGRTVGARRLARGELWRRIEHVE